MTWPNYLMPVSNSVGEALINSQTLSVCMIIKNEQDFLDGCLRSIQDVADEIIILDTGSTDKSLDIARKYKAKIHTFDWIDDFSTARNESIRQASGDWILWLDADERLLPESVPELKKLLKPESKPLAYILQIQNLLPDGKNYKLSGAHRLFTNHKGIHFSGRIHEQIAYSLSELGGEERKCTVSLIHLGYGLDTQTQDKKNQRNRHLLLQMVKDEPENAYAHYTLAQNYGLEKEWKKASEHYRIAMVKHKFEIDMECSLYNTYAESLFHLKKIQEAKELASKSIQRIPRQVGAYYLLFKITEQTPESLEWLLKLEQMNSQVHKKGKQLSSDVLLPRDDILFEIIKRYEQLNQPGSVLKWIGQLTPATQERPDILLKKARSALSFNDPQTAKQTLDHPRLAKNPEALDLLGLIYIQSGSFDAAIQIYEQLFKIMPHDRNIVKRLAGLYAKTGQNEQATILVEYLNK